MALVVELCHGHFRIKYCNMNEKKIISMLSDPRGFYLRQMKQKIFMALAILLLLPLFFLNVKTSHDWGDDFAQYLIQAKNIVHHHSQTDNSLIYNGQVNCYSLPAYPVGFPLLLKPFII